MTLEFLPPVPAFETLNVLLYGPPGTGKTVGACTAPGPILLVNAEGRNAATFARSRRDDIHEIALERSNDLRDIIAHLKSDDRTERTVVVDSLGEAYNAFLREQAGDGPPEIRHYGTAQTKMQAFLTALRDMPINVVLVAHEQIDDSEGEMVRRPLIGGQKLPELVMRHMDVVAYTGVLPADDDHPESRYVGQVVQANGRRAKDRTGVLSSSSPVLPLDISGWLSMLNNKESSK